MSDIQHGRLNQEATPFAAEQITVDNTAGGKSLTAATYAPTSQLPAAGALITVMDQPIRYVVTPGATAPSATNGHFATDNDTIELGSLTAIKGFKAIREGGSSAVLYVTYFR